MGNLDRLWDPWHMNKPKRKRRKTAKHDLESAVLKECMVWLKRRGYYAERRNTGEARFGDVPVRFGIPGGADVFAIINGHHVEIEMKRRNGGVLSDNQKAFRRMMKGFGIPYIVVHSAEQLEAWVGGMLLHWTR